jgi:hypothetical protein
MIYAAGVIFVFAYLWNGYHNRPAHDDLEFLSKVKELGITGSVSYYYETWNTRWAAILVANTFYLLYENSGSFIPFHLITLAIWFVSVFLLLQNTAGLLGYRTGKGALSLLTSCVVSGIFFITYNIADSYFWVNTSAMYHWNIMACLLFAVSFTGRSSPFIKYLAATITGVYIGGSGETFAVLILATLSSILITNLRFRLLTQTALLWFFFTMITTGFVISFLGEGHVQRSELLPHTTVMFKLWVLVKSMIKFFIFRIPEKTIPLILFTMPWYFIGSDLNKQRILSSGHIRPVKVIFTVGIAIFITALLTFTPLAYLMSEMGPERAWNHLAWIIYLSAAALFFFWGNRRRDSFINTIKTQRFGSAAILAFVIIQGSQTCFQVQKYSDSWDSRVATIKKELLSYATDTIVIHQKLPVTDWLHNGEISTDPGHFTNQHLKLYLGSDKEIILSPNAAEH